MKIPVISIVLLALSMCFTTAIRAEEADGYVRYSVEADFEDVFFDMQDAVIAHGLVVDYVGNVDDMLARTSETVGSASPYLNAKYLLFCSAALTHEAVKADPANLAVCPYVVFAYETKNNPGVVVTGYRVPALGSAPATMSAFAKVRALMDDIVREAAGQ